MNLEPPIAIGLSLTIKIAQTHIIHFNYNGLNQSNLRESTSNDIPEWFFLSSISVEITCITITSHHYSQLWPKN